MPIYTILASIFAALVSFSALADEATTLPVEERSEFFCLMALGNVQGDIQEAKDLYLEVFAEPEGVGQTGKYGLLTGMYYGDRGTSQFGPTLDDPKTPRFYADGTQAQNEHVQWLRGQTAAFRRTKCEVATPK